MKSSGKPSKEIPKKIFREGSPKKTERPVYKEFRFKALFGIQPDYYLNIFYVVALLAALYYLFLDPGLRNPQVRLRFYVLAGDASLYVNGKFYHNLNFSSDWENSSTVLIPAGESELRIVKSGMEPWVLRQEFQPNIWNNRWNPKTFSFEVRLETGTPEYLWQEAWRGYLYRGLEAQKELSFDASHPYPWVLSAGLRSVLYSGETLPEYWSADLQRGLASTTDMYQWGDLLAAYSLLSQARGKGVGLLGPRSLAMLARSALKRLQRLEPKEASFLDAWEKGVRAGMPQAVRQADFWQGYSRLAKTSPNFAATPALSAPGQVALEFGGSRFMAIPDQNFALQETGVSNAQFARFWFSDAGKELRVADEQAQMDSLASLVLYDDDRRGPADWPENAEMDDILSNPLLQGRPVRGITWWEARAFAAWMNTQMAAQSGEWSLRLPRLPEHKQIARFLMAGGEPKPEKSFDFRIPKRPPRFADQKSNWLGLKGLSGSLWEWYGNDYLPYSFTAPS
ncbi:MAG: SUMF1/EgtB/PvdO family nonheme iron enzyme, partial [Spirochaetota bacterium]